MNSWKWEVEGLFFSFSLFLKVSNCDQCLTEDYWVHRAQGRSQNLEETTGFLCVIQNNIKLSRRNGWAILPDNFSTHIFVSQNAFWKAYMTVEMNKIQHFTTTSINLTRKNIYPVISLNKTKQNLLKLEKLIYWFFWSYECWPLRRKKEE